MPDAMIQVRVDADLFKAAKSAGAAAGRRAAAQIRHWARIGRETVALMDEDAEDAQEAAEILSRIESGQERTYTTAEVADVPTPDDALEDAADVAAFDAAMAEEGENIPWAQVEVRKFGATSAELQALLGDRLPTLQTWMRGQPMGVCPEHGPVVYRSDLERFLADGPVLD